MPAWTWARTRSAGTWPTTTASPCPGPPWPGTRTGRGLVVPEPKKRPKSSYVRFQAEQPNGCWQADFTHYRLTRPDGRPGSDTEILSWLDDHSRFALSVTAH